MKKTSLIFFVFALLLIGFSACKEKTIDGEGAVIKEERTVSPFNEIEIGAPIHAIVRIDSNSAGATTLQIEGYGNLLPYIKSEVDGAVLKISLDGVNISSDDKDVIAYISVPALKTATFNGYATADIDGKIKGERFDLSISGAGDVKIAGVYVNELEAKISGAGTVEIMDGYAEEATYRISGAGDIKAFGLVSQEVDAKVSGAGSMEVNAVKKLDAHISGAGNIDYRGQPTVESKLSGMGSVNKVDQ